MGYLMSKAFFSKDCSGILQPIAGGDKGIHAFPSLKVNAMMWPQFEHTYYNIVSR